MSVVKIKGTSYSRDLTNGAVLCNDRSMVDKYHQELKRDQEINELKSELQEIKDMLRALIRG